MMSRSYTTQLQAGLGMVEETRSLLNLWQEGMDSLSLQHLALESGIFPNMSARRVRNVVAECFSPRYLSQDPPAAKSLKALEHGFTSREFEQLLFLYTCRANAILSGFVNEVYWPAYASGRDQLSNENARDFVIRAVQEGKTTTAWSDNTIVRVARYLTGTCADFGLLERESKSSRAILPYRIEDRVAAYLAYDLHLASVGDNSVVSHADWRLFGLESSDVIEEIKRLGLKGWLIFQSAGSVVRIGWNYRSMEEVLDVLTEGEL